MASSNGLTFLVTIDDYITRSKAQAVQTTDNRFERIGFIDKTTDLTHVLCLGDTFRCRIIPTSGDRPAAWKVVEAETVRQVPRSPPILGSLWTHKDYVAVGRHRAYITSPFLDPIEMEQYIEKAMALLFDSRLPRGQLASLESGTFIRFQVWLCGGPQFPYCAMGARVVHGRMRAPFARHPSHTSNRCCRGHR